MEGEFLVCQKHEMLSKLAKKQWEDAVKHCLF